MVLSARRSFGDDRTTTRRSAVDRIQSTLARLSLKQLILLCVAFTILIKISWRGDKSPDGTEYPTELNQVDPIEQQVDEQPEVVVPQLSWAEQLEQLPEISLPGG